MHNKIRISLLSSMLFISNSLYAANILEENNICNSNGDTVFAFFNGVMTPHDLALENLRKLKSIQGQTTSDGGKIKYELMYNYTNGFEDFVETFEQRFKEQGELQRRWELFFQFIQDNGSWWDKIKQKIIESTAEVDQWNEVLQANFIKNLTTLLANPPTISNYQEHQSRIDNWALEGKKLLFVAHSQGNLFANNAYNYASASISSDSMKVVHVAPASPVVNGPHVLANQDLVINGLRIFGSVPSNTDSIPVYNPLGNNYGRDFLGHGLFETYMNPAFTTYTNVKNHIKTSIDNLKTPPAQASTGFFTVTLTWDGAGDVDLHTFEPSGSHVYYRSKQGTSGYLDVDNTSANGPEHYFASCDKTILKTGVYAVKLANYANADGRNASVQISSDAAGVLGTKSVIMGSATGDSANFDMFNVRVSQNPETLKYTVSLE